MELFLLTFLMLLLSFTGIGILAALILNIAGDLITGVPFVPVPHNVVEEVVKLAPKETGVFYDIGSGEGRVVAAVARRYPEMQAIGIEKAPFPFLLTLIKGRAQIPNTKFLFKDSSRVDLRDASYVFMYLFPKVVHALEAKLEKELPAGSRVVCCDFPLKRATTKTEKVFAHKKSYTLYVYDW